MKRPYSTEKCKRKQGENQGYKCPFGEMFKENFNFFKFLRLQFKVFLTFFNITCKISMNYF